MFLSNLNYRRRYRLIFLALLLTTLLAPILLANKVQAPTGSWWNLDWKYRKSITISDTSNTALSNFQVKLTVEYVTSKMKSDFSDLRFIAYDQTTSLSYWIQSYTASISATVWVKIPTIPASGSTIIYMYYNNPTATDAGNPNTLFEFFDNFPGSSLDTNKWTANAVNSITYNVNNYFRFTEAAKSGGTYWIYSGVSTGSQHQAKWTPISQFVVECKSAISDTDGTQMGEGCVGIIATDNTIIGVAGHQDWMGGPLTPWRAAVTENTISSIGSGVTKDTGGFYAYKGVIATDATSWKIVNDGTKVEFYDDAGFFAQAPITSSVSKLALTAGAYGGYPYLNYVQIDYVLVRKYASSDPTVSFGYEQDQWMRGWIVWLNLSWPYRKPITITGNSGSAYFNYQVKLTVNHVPSKMKSDFSDLRFTASDQVTLIPYWIESFTASSSATVWVKAPVIPASGTTTIYMYYGNLGASSASNGLATFEFFDDFETIYPTGWTEKASMPAPWKADTTAAVYNSKLYVFGGYKDGSTWLKETYLYDPSLNSWTQKADMPTARWGPLAVEFNGLIYVFGGTVSVNEVYDPTTDTWSSKTGLPSGFDQGLMGVRYGDKIHLFYKNLHYEYDPALDTGPSPTPYTRLADVPTWRTWSTCAVVGTKIYVIGGYSYGPSSSGAVNVNEVYDPGLNTWTTKAPLPVSKYGITRENPVINGKIYVTHGLNGGFHTDNYVYDPSADLWTQKSGAAHPRDGVACGVINNKLYVVGGRDLPSSPVGVPYNEEYDPSADTGPSNPWTFSNSAKVKTDSSAKYEGNYGLLVSEDSTTSPQPEQYAEYRQSFGTCAVDLYWDVTDDYGTVNPPSPGPYPTGRILLADRTNPSLGSLYYYQDSGSKFKWYLSGSFTVIDTGSWNTWYRVTMIWNGANSKVIINDVEHAVTSTQPNCDRIYIGTQLRTKMYVDVVRVRKYASPSPTATLGTEQQPASIESYDDGGNMKDTFNPGDIICVKGSGYLPSTTYNIYVVSNVIWSNGMTIPIRVSGPVTTIDSDSSGNIPKTRVWTSASPGKYDIVVDIYQNGKYEASIDALDTLDISGAGFFVIPEYILGTLLALGMCFAGVEVYRRSKRKG
jgi:N-acetylneuraminic acid mutarotase